MNIKHNDNINTTHKQYEVVKSMNTLTVVQGSSPIVETQRVDATMFERYIAYIDASENTAISYAKDLKQLIKYLAENNINRPTRDDLMRWKDYLKDTGHKPTTIQNYITAAKVFFKWAAQEGLYPNIAEHIKGAKIDKAHKKDYLTTAQVKEVLSGVDEEKLRGQRDYAMLTLMITGGLRTIEVVRADIQDLRTVGDSTVLYIQGKGHEEKADYVKISPKVEKAIRAYLKSRRADSDTEPLFTSTSNNSKGNRLSTRTVRGIVKEYLRAAGYDSEKLTAHSLRHTAVTLSLLAGKPLEEVSQFARHASLSTTMIYNHALEKSKNSCSTAIAEAIL